MGQSIKKYGLVLFFLWNFIFLPGSQGAPAKIIGSRLAHDSQHTRLVLDLTAPVNFTLRELESDLIAITLPQTKLATNLNRLELSKTPIRSLKQKTDATSLQLLLRMKRKVKIQPFLWLDKLRLVIDFEETIIPDRSPARGNVEGTLEQQEQRLLSTFNAHYPASNRPTSPSNFLKKIVIVIDPGHGGKDPGAVGSKGSQEKKITLALAKKLAKIINQQAGFRAILTRNYDHYVPLRQRLQIAHRHKADLFLSIHADAYKERHSHGASIFALSPQGATSEAARWLAHKENVSELGQAIKHQDKMLSSILIDLAQNANSNISLELGSKILASITKIAALHSQRVEQAGFVVLKAPDIPSLLIEAGFISHPQEERLLTQSAYQLKLAQHIADGILHYFSLYKPSGSYIALKKAE